MSLEAYDWDWGILEPLKDNLKAFLWDFIFVQHTSKCTNQDFRYIPSAKYIWFPAGICHFIRSKFSSSAIIAHDAGTLITLSASLTLKADLYKPRILAPYSCHCTRQSIWTIWMFLYVDPSKTCKIYVKHYSYTRKYIYICFLLNHCPNTIYVSFINSFASSFMHCISHVTYPVSIYVIYYIGQPSVTQNLFLKITI